MENLCGPVDVLGSDCLCLLLTLAAAQTAKSHFEAGQRALKESRWVAAGREFEEAAGMDPANKRYQARYAEIRPEASRWAESAARTYLSVNNARSAQLMLIQALHFDRDNQSAAKLLTEVKERLAVQDAASQPALPEPPITNSTLVEMARLGLPADVITAKIRTAGTDPKFETSAQALAELRTAGVPDPVLVYVVENYGKSPIAAHPVPAMEDAGSGKFRWDAKDPALTRF